MKRTVLQKKFYIVGVSIILSLVMAVGLFLTGCVDSNERKISITDATGLAGDTVKLYFSISENDGLWGGQVIINYDSSALEFVSCASGDVFDECESNDNKGSLNLLVNQSGMDNVKKDGLIATLNFKIKDIANDGKYDISFDEETNFATIDGDIKEVLFENGTITVK